MQDKQLSLSKTDKVTIQDEQVENMLSEMQTVKNMIAENATNEELRLFALHCSRTGLDPFSGQIHFVKRGNKSTFQTSIDGFRVIAERSNQYAGQTEIKFGEMQKKKMHYRVYENGRPVKKTVEKEVPSSVTIGIHRTGFKHPVYATVYFDEFCPAYPNQTMWLKMPRHMLAKVAEAHALRKAFPNDLSNLYIPDEMDQSEGVEVETVDKGTGIAQEETVVFNPKEKTDVEKKEGVVDEIVKTYLQNIEEAKSKYKLESVEKQIDKGFDAGLITDDQREMLGQEIESRLSKLTVKE